MLRRTLIIATCLLLVALIGWLDYVSGFENSLLIFYLAPIALGTWFLGLWFGIAIAIFCVTATVLSDLAAGLPGIAIWNCASAFVAYLIFIFLLQRCHSLLSEMHLRVKERTADLQRELARRQQLEKEIAVVAEEERNRVGRELHDSLGQSRKMRVRARRQPTSVQGIGDTSLLGGARGCHQCTQARPAYAYPDSAADD